MDQATYATFKDTASRDTYVRKMAVSSLIVSTQEIPVDSSWNHTFRVEITGANA